MPDQKGFLEEIQSLSEGTKKRVLIIATVLIMIIIVGVWFAYFNSIFAPNTSADLSQATTTPAATTPIAVVPAPTAAAASGPGLWQNIESGFSSIFRSIANIFSRPSNYQIQPN